jgi:hypothetical protein
MANDIRLGCALGILYNMLARWMATGDNAEEALWREMVINQVRSVAAMLDAKEDN